ncbi:MAG: methylmalonyl-CoA mutase [Chloroflexi bacterium]|nr:MAG: methylmalonyl-CoA mutase [Chloroflexota bacterium]
MKSGAQSRPPRAWRSSRSTHRPTWRDSITSATWPTRASTRTRAGLTRSCTGKSSGRCAPTRGSAPCPRPTPGTGACSRRRASPGSPPRWTCPPRWATTPTIQSGGCSFTINAPAFLFLALYQVTGEKQGVPAAQLRPIVQNDILKEFFARGACVFPVEPSLRLVADTFEYCASVMPRANPISVCGYHIRESGATAVQEMAFAISNAIEYIERALARGIPIDAFAPRISWNLGAFMNFFEEVAKYRASRRIWARLMRETYGAQDPRSWRFLWFAGTCGSTFSHRQPLNNIVRATVETMALVLGGLQSLTVNTWQEAYEIPDQEAMLTALRTQQVVAYESGVADTADPLAGSYFVESLTDEYERRILALMAEVKERGGMARGIESGWVQQQVLEEAYRHSMAVESGERLIVGENIFQSADEPPPIRLYQHDPAVLEEQVRRLREVRARRDGAAVGRALDALRSAARRPDQNLMPATVECVRAYCTIGEIMGVLRDEFGTFQEPLDIFG